MGIAIYRPQRCPSKSEDKGNALRIIMQRCMSLRAPALSTSIGYCGSSYIRSMACLAKLHQSITSGKSRSCSALVIWLRVDQMYSNGQRDENIRYQLCAVKLTSYSAIFKISHQDVESLSSSWRGSPVVSAPDRKGFANLCSGLRYCSVSISTSRLWDEAFGCCRPN